MEPECHQVYTVGATSLLTTVEDLALWDENFYNPRVGGAALVQQLQERGKLNDGTRIDYAAGLVLGKYRGLNIVDHNGGDAGYRSDMIRFPDQHFTVACLCSLSTANPTDFTHKVADIYLANEMQPAETAHADDSGPVTLTPKQMQTKAGVYVNVNDPDDMVRWVIHDGQLQVGNIGQDRTYPVKAISENQFHFLLAPVDYTFLSSTPGAPQQLAIKLPDGKIETYSAVPVFVPSPAQLAEYAGIYSSKEIDPLYELKIETSSDGKESLVLHRLKSDPDTLQLVTHDFFTARAGKIRFTRNMKGVISGFVLSSGRVLDLRFERGRPAVPAR